MVRKPRSFSTEKITEPIKDRLEGAFNGESRAISDVAAVAVMMVAAVGLGAALFTQAGGFVDGIESPPKADIAVDPGSNDVQFTVRSASNADDLYVDNGSDLDTTALDATAGDSHTVSGLSGSGTVTVIAHVAPDQNRTVATYNYGG